MTRRQTAAVAPAAIITGSRMLYGMAKEGDLPAVIASVLKGRKTPWVATLILGAGAAAPPATPSG